MFLVRLEIDNMGIVRVLGGVCIKFYKNGSELWVEFIRNWNGLDGGKIRFYREVNFG